MGNISDTLSDSTNKGLKDDRDALIKDGWKSQETNIGDEDGSDTGTLTSKESRESDTDGGGEIIGGTRDISKAFDHQQTSTEAINTMPVKESEYSFLQNKDTDDRRPHNIMCSEGRGCVNIDSVRGPAKVSKHMSQIGVKTGKSSVNTKSCGPPALQCMHFGDQRRASDSVGSYGYADDIRPHGAQPCVTLLDLSRNESRHLARMSTYRTIGCQDSSARLHGMANMNDSNNIEGEKSDSLIDNDNKVEENRLEESEDYTSTTWDHEYKKTTLVVNDENSMQLLNKETIKVPLDNTVTDGKETEDKNRSFRRASECARVINMPQNKHAIHANQTEPVNMDLDLNDVQGKGCATCSDCSECTQGKHTPATSVEGLARSQPCMNDNSQWPSLSRKASDDMPLQPCPHNSSNSVERPTKINKADNIECTSTVGSLGYIDQNNMDITNSQNSPDSSCEDLEGKKCVLTSRVTLDDIATENDDMKSSDLIDDDNNNVADSHRPECNYSQDKEKSVRKVQGTLVNGKLEVCQNDKEISVCEINDSERRHSQDLEDKSYISENITKSECSNTLISTKDMDTSSLMDSPDCATLIGVFNLHEIQSNDQQGQKLNGNQFKDQGLIDFNELDHTDIKEDQLSFNNQSKDITYEINEIGNEQPWICGINEVLLDPGKGFEGVTRDHTQDFHARNEHNDQQNDIKSNGRLNNDVTDSVENSTVTETDGITHNNDGVRSSATIVSVSDGEKTQGDSCGATNCNNDNTQFPTPLITQDLAMGAESSRQTREDTDQNNYADDTHISSGESSIDSIDNSIGIKEFNTPCPQAILDNEGSGANDSVHPIASESSLHDENRPKQCQKLPDGQLSGTNDIYLATAQPELCSDLHETNGDSNRKLSDSQLSQRLDTVLATESTVCCELQGVHAGDSNGDSITCLEHKCIGNQESSPGDNKTWELEDSHNISGTDSSSDAKDGDKDTADNSTYSGVSEDLRMHNESPQSLQDVEKPNTESMDGFTPLKDSNNSDLSTAGVEENIDSEKLCENDVIEEPADQENAKEFCDKVAEDMEVIVDQVEESHNSEDDTSSSGDNTKDIKELWSAKDNMKSCDNYSQNQDNSEDCDGQRHEALIEKEDQNEVESAEENMNNANMSIDSEMESQFGVNYVDDATSNGSGSSNDSHGQSSVIIARTLDIANDLAKLQDHLLINTCNINEGDSGVIEAAAQDLAHEKVEEIETVGDNRGSEPETNSLNVRDTIKDCESEPQHKQNWEDSNTANVTQENGALGLAKGSLKGAESPSILEETVVLESYESETLPSVHAESREIQEDLVGDLVDVSKDLVDTSTHNTQESVENTPNADGLNLENEEPTSLDNTSGIQNANDATRSDKEDGLCNLDNSRSSESTSLSNTDGLSYDESAELTEIVKDPKDKGLELPNSEIKETVLTSGQDGGHLEDNGEHSGQNNGPSSGEGWVKIQQLGDEKGLSPNPLSKEQKEQKNEVKEQNSELKRRKSRLERSQSCEISVEENDKELVRQKSVDCFWTFSSGSDCVFYDCEDAVTSLTIETDTTITTVPYCPTTARVEYKTVSLSSEKSDIDNITTNGIEDDLDGGSKVTDIKLDIVTSSVDDNQLALQLVNNNESEEVNKELSPAVTSQTSTVTSQYPDWMEFYMEYENMVAQEYVLDLSDEERDDKDKIKLELEIAELKHHLKAATDMVTDTKKHMERQRQRTKQLVCAWRMKLQQQENEMTSYQTAMDDQMRNIASELLFLQGKLKREQSEVGHEIIQKDKVIKKQQEIIDTLLPANANLAKALKSTRKKLKDVRRKYKRLQDETSMKEPQDAGSPKPPQNHVKQNHNYIQRQVIREEQEERHVSYIQNGSNYSRSVAPVLRRRKHGISQSPMQQRSESMYSVSFHESLDFRDRPRSASFDPEDDSKSHQIYDRSSFIRAKSLPDFQLHRLDEHPNENLLCEESSGEETEKGENDSENNHSPDTASPSTSEKSLAPESRSDSGVSVDTASDLSRQNSQSETNLKDIKKGSLSRSVSDEGTSSSSSSSSSNLWRRLTSPPFSLSGSFKKIQKPRDVKKRQKLRPKSDTGCYEVKDISSGKKRYKTSII